MPSRSYVLPAHVWRLLAFIVCVVAGLYLLVSPACDCLRDAEARRREEAQYSNR